jgi:hypothetical protein
MRMAKKIEFPLTLILSPEAGGEGKKKIEETPSPPLGERMPEGRVRGASC